MKFKPTLNGPCIGCGDVDYPLSIGGPTICPSCDLGIDPQVSKLRKECEKLLNENMRLRFALIIVTGNGVEGLNERMKEIGETCLKEFKKG
jgi:hypothetical protein